jgi:hypothetical protein
LLLALPPLVTNDCYVCEIPPGKALDPQKYEEMILVLSGRGSTSVWPMMAATSPSNGRRAPHQRPSVLNDDLDFLFGPDFDLKKRFTGEPDFFSAEGEQKGFMLTTNFVPDAVNLPLIDAKERGAGGGHIRFNMAGRLDREPHFAVPGRHLQEGARS